MKRTINGVEYDIGPRTDLKGANLKGADLSGANLRGANLRWANLSGANLREANLREADLGGANLREANLHWAHLHWANLKGANLPSPPEVLLASFGALPDGLTADLMAYDAACHPDPESFTRWATIVATRAGPCPYNGGRVQRAANFSQRPSLWDPARPLRRPYDLMIDALDSIGCGHDLPHFQGF